MKNIDFKQLLLRAEIILSDAKKILWFIGEHAFLAILFLILLDVIFGAFLFYKYLSLAETKTVRVNSAYFQFNDNTYQKVLKQQEIRSQKLEESLQKDYPSPF